MRAARCKNQVLDTVMALRWLLNVLSTLVGALVAYALTLTDMPWKRWLRNLVVLPLVSPPFAVSFAIILLFGRRGVITYDLLNIKNYNIYGPQGINYLVAIVGDKLVAGLNEEDMEKALGAVQGRADVALLRDDPMVKTLANKIGLDRASILMPVPARIMEAAIQLMAKASGQQGAAVPPLPYATPMAIGAKAVEGGIIRCDVYLPRACIAECMTMVGALVQYMSQLPNQ